MTPKDGTAGTALKPLEPKAVTEADNADPGEVSESKAREMQTQSGKYGTAPIKPFKPPPPEEAKEKTWVEIQLNDQNGDPVPNERYRIKLPDGSTVDGSLDSKGFARVDGIDPGQAEVTFPYLDQDGWDENTA